MDAVASKPASAEGAKERSVAAEATEILRKDMMVMKKDWSGPSIYYSIVVVVVVVCSVKDWTEDHQKPIRRPEGRIVNYIYNTLHLAIDGSSSFKFNVT